MTIAQAILRCDDLKPNDYTPEEKIEWLSRLDGRIKIEIINTHEGAGNEEFDGYTETTSTDTSLLVPTPYDEMYLYWLLAQIDYSNGEIKKYNSNIAMFNATYRDYASYYNRTHMPKPRNFKFF